jgi:hypothetical protein
MAGRRDHGGLARFALSPSFSSESRWAPNSRGRTPTHTQEPRSARPVPLPPLRTTWADNTTFALRGRAEALVTIDGGARATSREVGALPTLTRD